MKDQYTVQRYIAGVSAGGHLRHGILICRIDPPQEDNGILSYHLAYPEQWLDCEEWKEVFKRYPRNQVIRLPDVDVQYREIKVMRSFEKARQQACK